VPEGNCSRLENGTANEENPEPSAITDKERSHDHKDENEDVEIVDHLEPVGKQLWLPFQKQQMLLGADDRKISSSSGIKIRKLFFSLKN
jgi:hypothetical protein